MRFYVLKRLNDIMNSSKRFILAILLITFFTACAQPKNVIVATNSTAGYPNVNLLGLEKDILLYINQYRATIGKLPLQMINAASKQATAHS